MKRESRKAVSSVITSVLIVMISIAVVAILFVAINPMIREKITLGKLQTAYLSAGYQSNALYDPTDKIGKISISSGFGQDIPELIKLRVIFEVDGNSVSFTTPDAPSPGETRNYYFDLSGGGEPSSVIIAPIFLVNGEEVLGTPSEEIVTIGEIADIPWGEVIEQWEDVAAPSIDGTLEGCYISLTIDETKVSEETDADGNVISQTVDYSLSGQENVYDYLEGSVNDFSIEDESGNALVTYDSNGNILSKYALYSGRFAFYDGFDEVTGEASGGVIEFDSATISGIIPYDSRISSIKIEEKGVITDLNVNVGDFECMRTCKIDGEGVNLESGKCCIGNIPFEENGNYVCKSPELCTEDCSAYSDGEFCYDYKLCECETFTCPDGWTRDEAACGCTAPDVTKKCEAGEFGVCSESELSGGSWSTRKQYTPSCTDRTTPPAAGMGSGAKMLQTYSCNNQDIWNPYCTPSTIDCSAKTPVQGINYECISPLTPSTEGPSYSQCWPQCKIANGVCSYSPDGINVISQPEKYCGDGGRICQFTCDYNGGDGKGKCLTSSSSSLQNTFCQSCSAGTSCVQIPGQPASCKVPVESACPSSISSCAGSFTATIIKIGSSASDNPSFMKSSGYSKPSGSGSSIGWNSAGIGGASMSGCTQSGNPSIYCQNNEWTIWVPGANYKSLGTSACPAPQSYTYTFNGNSCEISVA